MLFFVAVVVLTVCTGMSNWDLTELFQRKIIRQNLLERIPERNWITWVHLKQQSPLNQGSQTCFLWGHSIDLFNFWKVICPEKGKGNCSLSSMVCNLIPNSCKDMCMGENLSFSSFLLLHCYTHITARIYIHHHVPRWTVFARLHVFHRGLPWESLFFLAPQINR